MKCSFCGKECQRVFRVALARDYDRLSVVHPIKWACLACHLKCNRELNERYGLDLPTSQDQVERQG